MKRANEELKADHWTVRPPVLDDAPAVTGLMNLCAMLHTGSLQMTVDQLTTIWTAPGFDLNADAWLLLAPGDRLVGYAELWREPADEVLPYVWLHIHPGVEAVTVGAVLLRRAEARVRRLTGHTCGRLALRTATVSFDQAARRLLSHEGFRLAARRWQMATGHAGSSEPRVTDCVVCRAYVPGEEAWQMWRYDIFEKEILAEAS